MSLSSPSTVPFGARFGSKDKNGIVYPLDEVTREELDKGLEKISKEIAERLLLLKEQRWNLVYPLFQEIPGARI
jgi:hypothetical protein